MLCLAKQVMDTFHALHYPLHLFSLTLAEFPSNPPSLSMNPSPLAHIHSRHLSQPPTRPHSRANFSLSLSVHVSLCLCWRGDVNRPFTHMGCAACWNVIVSHHCHTPCSSAVSGSTSLIRNKQTMRKWHWHISSFTDYFVLSVPSWKLTCMLGTFSGVILFVLLCSDYYFSNSKLKVFESKISLPICILQCLY